MKKADAIKQALVSIAEANSGILRPADVVNAARAKSSPLHSQFEWDNSKAAEQFRLRQAQKLIRVTVEYLGPEDTCDPTRVFVSLTPDRLTRGGGYRELTQVLANRNFREQLLQDAFTEMQHFQQKYAQLKELGEVFAAMRKVSPKLKKKAA